MTTSFLHIPITVDTEDYEEKVLDILSKVKPTWERTKIDMEKNTKGFANILLICQEKNGSETSNNSRECDKIIVRVFGGNLGDMARQAEIEIMKILSENGIIPKVYGSFQNGVVYDYAPGIIPTKEQILHQKILLLIAVKLHSIHSFGGENLKQNIENKTYIEWFELFWTVLNTDDFKSAMDDPRFKDHFGSLENIGKMKSEAVAAYEDLDVRYPPVFCHMDPHNNNIVYDSETDEVTFIDWEMCHMAPEVFDLAIIVDRDTDLNEKDALDNPGARSQWVRTYLSTHPQYKSEPITDELFQQWYRDSIRASMVSTFGGSMWSLFSVVQSAKAKEFDFFRCVKHQIGRFYRYRKELSEMEKLDTE